MKRRQLLENGRSELKRVTDRAVWLCLSAAHCLSLLAACPVRAELSIDVSPLRIEVRAQSGETHTNSITVQNSSDEPVRLRAYVEDWNLTEQGVPLFLPAGTQPRSLAQWIDWAPGDFLLEPGEKEHVRFSIEIPDGTCDGGYYGCLLLESIPLDRAEGPKRQVFIRGRVACMVYLSVGNPPRGAKITALSTIVRDQQTWLRLSVRNIGEDHFRVNGEVSVLAGGEAIREPLNLPNVPVLPGGLREIEIELPIGALEKELIAQVAIDLPGLGRLLGECAVDLPRADLVRQ
jgi:P pilus assembly chaperone PapD